jgi:hypothetical protein
MSVGFAAGIPCVALHKSLQVFVQPAPLLELWAPMYSQEPSTIFRSGDPESPPQMVFSTEIFVTVNVFGFNEANCGGIVFLN